MPVYTDAQWSALEPLIESVRPQTGRELSNLRQTFEAMVWRMQNGAKWRAIPAELGPWWRAAQTFLRWSKLGVWERLFEAAKAASWPELGMVFMDGTVIRAHHKAAGAVKGGAAMKLLAEARAVLAPRPMPLPTHVVGLWALRSPPDRPARPHKALIFWPFCRPSRAGSWRTEATRLTRCARPYGILALGRPSRPGATRLLSTARTGSM